MANGRGSLECCYCEFYRCHNVEWRGYDAAYEAGECLLHRAALPGTTAECLHRVCRDFKPNELFAAQSQISAAERFSWFPTALAAGLLYGFGYNTPGDVHPIADLRSSGSSPA